MHKLHALPIRIKLNENAIREALTKADQTEIRYEVQLLRTGVFSHPDFGEFTIDTQMLNSMVQNWNEEVRGIDIPIDYAHRSDLEAAGWVQGLTLKENEGKTELWAIVDWTPAGIKRLAEKEYRYLSADFTLDYQDNETLKKFGPTLLGAGLTNRPFVKNMQPAVTLDEREGKNDMTLEALQKQIADMEAKNKELSEKLLTFQNADYEKKLSEKDAELKKVQEQVASLIAEKATSEKEREFEKLLSEGGAVPAQKEAYMAGDVVKFAQLSKPTNKSEDGNAGNASKKSEDYDSEVVKLAEEKCAKDKSIGFGTAIGLVLSENPKLAEQYTKDKTMVEV